MPDVAMARSSGAFSEARLSVAMAQLDARRGVAPLSAAEGQIASSER